MRRCKRNHNLRALNSFAFLLACGFAVLAIAEEPLATPTVAIYYWTVLVTCGLESAASTRLAWRPVERVRVRILQEAGLAYDAHRV